MKLIESLGELVIPDGKFSRYNNLFRIDGSGSWWDNRVVDHNMDILTNGAAEWHQDSPHQSFENPFPAIVIWTNMYPTEVLLPDGSIVAPKANEIVVLDNKRVKHRSPIALVELLKDGTNPSRNFARHIIRTRQPSDADLDIWRKRIVERQAQINRECSVTR